MSAQRLSTINDCRQELQNRSFNYEFFVFIGHTSDNILRSYLRRS